jgi:hypothetical protein
VRSAQYSGHNTGLHLRGDCCHRPCDNISTIFQLTTNTHRHCRSFNSATPNKCGECWHHYCPFCLAFTFCKGGTSTSRDTKALRIFSSRDIINQSIWHIMNNSTSHNMSTPQPPRGDGNPLGEFFNTSIQPYANYPPENEASQEEFMWDPSLFHNPQLFSPPVATHTPAWNQNGAAQPRDPPFTAYGGLQSSFQLSQYGQPSFDPRQPSPQPGHDPRSMSRPSPSPTQYSNHNGQPAMVYRDLSYQNQQQFNPQTMVYPQRPNSTSTPTFDGHASQSPYFNYASHMVGQSQLQVSLHPRSASCQCSQITAYRSYEYHGFF